MWKCGRKWCYCGRGGEDAANEGLIALRKRTNEKNLPSSVIVVNKPPWLGTLVETLLADKFTTK